MSTTVRSLQYEHFFKTWNVQYKLTESIQIDSVRFIDDAQVRHIEHIAIPENVEQYALQMKAGAIFPPIVTWSGMLVDGNTRMAAARLNGMATIAAYEIDVPSIRLARFVAAGLNMLGGAKLTSQEARELAIDMMEDAFTDSQIALTLGVTAESARQWRRLHEVNERAERTGTTEALAKMNKSKRLQLANITHDAPFRELALAIVGANPDVAEIKDVVAKVKEASSDDAAVAIVADARREWTPIGPEPVKVRVNRAAQQARMHIGGLLKCRASDLVDPAKMDADRAKWQEIARLASEVLHLMDEAAA